MKKKRSSSVVTLFSTKIQFPKVFIFVPSVGMLLKRYFNETYITYFAYISYEIYEVFLITRESDGGVM